MRHRRANNPLSTQVERASGKQLPSGVATTKRVQGRDLKAQLKSLGRGLLGRALDNEEVLAQAEEYHTAHVKELAKTVGDGVCPAQAGAIVASAALELAASRYYWQLFWSDDGTVDEEGNPVARSPQIAATASKLGAGHRQHTLAAYEVTARMAKNRRDALKRGDQTKTLTSELVKGLKK